MLLSLAELSPPIHCEGEQDIYNHQLYIMHENPGNARFCQQCGKPANFAKQKLLLPWEEARDKIQKAHSMDAFDDCFFDDAAFQAAAVEDDEDLFF